MGLARHGPSLRGGILTKLLVFCAVLFAVVALVWMLFLPMTATRWLRTRTGFDTSVQSLMVNPFTGRIVVRGLAINNPPTFPRPDFLLVREFEAETSLLSLFSDRPEFERVALDIALVALVKRADGRTNAAVFRDYLLPASPSGPQPAGQARPLRIRRLELKFDRFLVADHTPRQPVVRDYPLHINRTFENVSDPRQLLLPVAMDEFFALGEAVGGLLPSELAQAFDRALKAGTETARGLGQRAPAVLGGFTDALEESKKP